MKRFIRFSITAVMILLLFLYSTETVNAAEAPLEEIASGSCNGGDIVWSLNSSGVLEFIGSGAIDDFAGPDETHTNEMQSWYRYRNETRKIIIGEGITKIGKAAFADFKEIEISIPTSLKKIADSAFCNNSKLSKITIPDSVTELGKYSFYGCQSLAEITVGSGVAVISDCCFTQMENCVVKVSEGCSQICNSAFFGKVSRIDLPSTLTTIDVRAMGDGNSWQYIVGASDAAKTFAYNKIITYLDTRNHYILDEKNMVLTASEYAYTGEAIIPKVKVTHKVEDGVATLVEGEDYRLEISNNTDLGKATVKIIGIGIFEGSKSLDFKITADISKATVSMEYDSVAYDKKAKTPAVSVKILNRKLVNETEYSVTYTSNKSVGTATVTITGVDYVKGSISKTFTIFKKSFFDYDDCTYMITADSESLRTVTVAECSPDTSVVKIPATVKYEEKTYKVTAISANAFKNEKICKKVIIGSNVTKIGNNAFYGCKNLTTVKLPSGLKSIGSKAFYNCKKLKSLSLPEAVTSIGKNAFTGCKALKSLSFAAKTLPSIGGNAFKNVYSKLVVTVPSESLVAYKSLLKARGMTGSKQKVIGK